MRKSTLLSSILLAVLAAVLPSMALAQDSAAALCEQTKQAKADNNSELTCELARKAIELEGENACGGAAARMTSLYCRKAPKPDQTFDYHYNKDTPDNRRTTLGGPYKITIDPQNYSKVTLEEACTVAINAKIKKDLYTACEYGQVAYVKGGETACSGRAVSYMVDHCKKDGSLPSQSNNTRQPSANGMSIDDICSLAVKSKIKKDAAIVCEYSKRAAQIGGPNACKGTAGKLIHDYCDDKTIPEQLPAEQTAEPQLKKSDTPAPNHPELNDTCTRAVQAKIKKDYPKVCEYSKRAAQLGGPNACKGTAGKLIQDYCDDKTIPEQLPADQASAPSPSPSDSGMSLDDICAIAVRARIQKDYSQVCEYSKKALKKGGASACKGQAQEYVSQYCK